MGQLFLGCVWLDDLCHFEFSIGDEIDIIDWRVSFPVDGAAAHVAHLGHVVVNFGDCVCPQARKDSIVLELINDSFETPPILLANDLHVVKTRQRGEVTLLLAHNSGCSRLMIGEGQLSKVVPLGERADRLQPHHLHLVVIARI